jgi:protein tyrosine phosphatase
LTKQFEGGLLKCGNYWKDGEYGALRLKIISQAGGEDAVQQGSTGFDFRVATSPEVGNVVSEAHIPNITRVFELTHTGHPSAAPRRITQIQCISWPDFDVPEQPDTLLNLIKEVDEAMDSVPTTRTSEDDRQSMPPLLVHCGSFMIVRE